MNGGEKHYEMMWDCEYCGSKKLLGKTHRYCPECGAVQNPQKRYFPPENEKVAVEDHKFVGADLHCPACKEAMSAAAKCCTNCGSPMAGGAQAARQADAFIGGPPPAPKKSNVGVILAVIGVLIFACIGLVIVNKCATSEVGLEVAKLTWKREIEVLRYDDVEDKGPCKSVPSDAKILKRDKPKPTCKTRKVDNGDGTFKEKEECDDPVETCTYRVKKWAVQRTLKEEGGVDENPKWPDVKLGKTGNCDGCEKEGDRTESYIVHFKDTKSGDMEECSFTDKDKWKSFEKGSKWQGETGLIAGDLKCDKLKKK
jgi:hypothetical protein